MKPVPASEFSNSKLPATAKDLNQELHQVLKDKDEAIQLQAFDQARKLRTREIEIQTKIQGTQGKRLASQDSCSPVVDEEDIADILASWTGVPVNKLTEVDSEKLLQMEATLHQRVVGQEEAVKAISQAMHVAPVWASSPNRPIASFIFSGPTGVGKTELAKAWRLPSLGLRQR